MNICPFLVVAALLPALLLTTGCEKKEGATQVAAKVNADEITVHQVNNILAQRQDIQPEATVQAKRAILERLINQQLLRQKAIEAQLDRTPEMLWAIESAKTEVLARAHLEGIARTLVKPTPLEIQQYYSKHPELFAQRRIFSLEEISFVANEDVAAGFRKEAPNLHSMKEIADWLQSQGAKFAALQAVRAAEQIPLAILPKIHAMKKDEVHAFETADRRFQVIRVADFLEAPVDEATATPRIQRFLFNQVAAAAIAQEMGEIRKQAKIEYLGKFADRAAAEKANVEGKAEVKSFTEAEAEAQARSEALTKKPSGK